eukprot:jgi/Astpho2/770/Aster-00629
MHPTLTLRHPLVISLVKQLRSPVKGFSPEGKLHLIAGIRYHKIAFISVKVKVYAVALYVEKATAQAELRRMAQEGQLHDKSVDAMCRALFNGNFCKVVELHMLRSVSTEDFKEGLQENLEPRLHKFGGMEHLKVFMQMFDKHKIVNGTKIKPEMLVTSDPLCKAMFDIYLGPETIVPDACKQFAKAALSLL